ncbi:MAG: CRTAC1 family protein [Bdellovibrionales bacterium]|nr:CRTAC1 family protein [Bdellovibrionales bacterium]
MKFQKSLLYFFCAFVGFLLFAKGQYFPLAPQGDSLFKQKIVLNERSEKANIHFTHKNDFFLSERFIEASKKILPFYNSISASVSVVDINNDGWQDFFVPSPSPNSKSHLYINQKDGTFVEKAVEYGLAQLSSPVRAGFFDCDNDGTQEILLTSYKCPSLYQNRGGKYQRIFKFPEPCTFAMGFNILDYDKDGLLDIAIAPFSRTLPNSWHSASNGPGGLMLYKNMGHCKFEADTNHLREPAKHYTHAIGVADLRNLNRQDLWAATDFNRDRIFFQNEDGGYSQAQEVLKKPKAHNGMSVSAAYVTNQKYPSIYISQVYEPGYSIFGNQLWTFDGQQFVDSAKERKINNCGWSWGSKFSDINNDGLVDLVVANGFISTTTGINYWDKIGRFIFASKRYLNNPWNWMSFEGASWSGHQRDCIFMNQGADFVNIAEQIHFDEDLRDGRGLATIDTLNNGKVGFIVANQRQKLSYYQNETESGNNWIGLKLIGTTSNRDAIGASVEAELSNGERKKYSHYPFNGYSAQSDSRIHIGLGKNNLKSIRVKWPHGLNELYTHLKMNQYNTLIESKGKLIETLSY